MGKIVAIDYGLKRLGLAISDASHTVALPWLVLYVEKDPLMILLKTLTPRLSEITTIVIGLPLLLSGEMGPMAKQVIAFQERLQQALPTMSIVLYDERLSSKQADREMQSLFLNRKQRSKTIDSRAAALFLQSYLDAHKQ